MPLATSLSLLPSPSPSSSNSRRKSSPIVSTRHRIHQYNEAPVRGRPQSGHNRLQSDLTRYNLGSPRVPVSTSVIHSATTSPDRPASCPPTFDPVPPYPGVTYSPDSRPVIPITISSSRSSQQIQPATSRSSSSSSSSRPRTALRSPSMSRQPQVAQSLPTDGATAIYGQRRVPTLPYSPSPPAYDDLYGRDPNKPVSRREAIARIARMVGRELVGGRK